MDRIDKYFCCHTKDLNFLVCHVDSFKLDTPNSPDTFTIPRYSYCHKVTIDKYKKTALCSCNERLSHGRPCVHILKVLNNKIHGSMFHPRYLKIINHKLYDTSPEIQDIYHKMVKDYRSHPNSVPLGNVWNDLKMCDRNVDGLSEGTTLQEKERMLHLRKWNEDKISFDRHSLQDLPFSADESELEPDPDIGMYVDFEMSINDCDDDDTESVIKPNQQSTENGETIDHRTWYNQMLAEVHDISKLCESRPTSKGDILQKLRDIKNNLTTTVHNELVQAGIMDDESEAQIVSSNMPMELSPARKRYRASYESIKRK